MFELVVFIVFVKSENILQFRMGDVPYNENFDLSMFKPPDTSA